MNPDLYKRYQAFNSLELSLLKPGELVQAKAIL